MTVFRNDGQWDASNVEFEEGRILAYSKKSRTPRMRYIDYGLGVFRQKLSPERVPPTWRMFTKSFCGLANWPLWSP